MNYNFLLVYKKGTRQTENVWSVSKKCLVRTFVVARVSYAE